MSGGKRTQPNVQPSGDGQDASPPAKLQGTRLSRVPWTRARSVITVTLLCAVVATMAVVRSTDVEEPAPLDPVAEPEIVGGRTARANEFPFAVALLEHGESDRVDAHFCGGSLIGPDLVLTAAHCVARERPAAVDALVGTHDLRSGGRRLQARRIHVHPHFDWNTAAYDVAVIELAAFAEPAPLVGVAEPTQAAAWSDGALTHVVGWGRTETGGYPAVLRTASVAIVNDTSCRQSYGSKLLEAIMVCAGYPGGGRDACFGDSGGPLLGTERARFLLVGIVSWGRGCALPGFPGVYAETAAMHDFLDPYLDGLRDVPRWADDAIGWMIENGYADGFPDRRFRPDMPLTRAQAVRILHRLVRPPHNTSVDAHPFGDVPAWIDEAVRWAAADQLMSGYPDGTFRPDHPMTRGEFAQLLWRLAGSPTTARHGYNDVGAWLSGSVSWMAAGGLATGWPDGTFRPDESLSRAQASRMLFRTYAGAG